MYPDKGKVFPHMMWEGKREGVRERAKFVKDANTKY